MFSYIKEYYDIQLYAVDDIKIFVKAGWITSDEFKKITNQDYAV